MERRTEKGADRGNKREGVVMVEKLKGLIFFGKREGPSTPPPTWRLEFPSQHNKNKVQEFLNFPTSTLSARSLCAKLWESQPQPQPHQLSSLPKMRTTLRRRRRRRHTHHPAKPPDSPSEQQQQQPKSASYMFKHHLSKHHKPVERNGCALQPVSPASYNCSMDVALHNRKLNPTTTSSSDIKCWIGESSCKPKTSREFVKTLNRIWHLEEQHATNISVVKALKMELELSQAQVKELLQQKQMNKKKMGHLKKLTTEDKLVRKNKEHDKIKGAIQSIMEEVEDERRLRKHSESLHWRLAKELSEVKSSFFGSLRDLERERKARILCEKLCDDFAKGIRDYEQEVCSLKQNTEKGHVKGGDSLDRLILQISEAWLDERMQMKQVQVGNDLPNRDSILNKLGVDNETFVHAKQYGNSNSSQKVLKEIYPCMHSLDSFLLKGAIKVPHNMAVNEGLEYLSNDTNKVHKEKKGISHNSMRKQVQSREMIIEDCVNVGKNICDETQGPQRMNSSQHMHDDDNIVGNSSLSSEGDQVYPESFCKEDSCVHSFVTSNVSPVKQWKTKLIVPDFDKYESCLEFPKGVKGNTLMAKLLEVRLKGQKSGSRDSKSSSSSTREVCDENVGM